MNRTFNLNKLPHTLELVQTVNGPELSYIDQRKLPYDLVIESTSSWTDVVDVIKTLAVRGAPAIGIAGAAALALFACHGGSQDDLPIVADAIANARPTAVNLGWAVKRACAALEGVAWSDAGQTLFDLVLHMQQEDEAANRAIGDNGAKLLETGAHVLTHCNAGSLGTYFYGTALGVIYSAAAQGKIEMVYADETRPVGQGARLTVWELSQAGIPVTLICDNMAASLMAQGRVDAILVGADRIAQNGDTANKIGTYGLAVLAKEHGLPFYVAAPTSTIDYAIEDGSSIVIEQRASAEVLERPIEGVDVWNPAFDVTPARLITGIITEHGVFTPDGLPSYSLA